MADNLAELCPNVLWKVDIVSDKFGYLAEEILSKMLMVLPSFSLLLIVKDEREREKLKKKLLSRKAPYFKI